MNIKTFRASSLQEGLALIREEWGENAHVMHTRQIDKRSFFGLRRQSLVEITAAEGAATNGESDFETPIAAIPKNRLIPPARSATPSAFQTPITTLELRSQPNTLTHSAPIRFKRDAKAMLAPSEIAIRGEIRCIVPIGRWNCLNMQTLNPTLLQRSVAIKLDDFVRFVGPFDIQPGRQFVASLVGLTGVGKTSLIAKIASNYKTREGRKVGLMTSDCFRVGGADQLQKYAEMLELPFESVSDPSRIPQALRRMERCDLILLDTPGISPKNTARLQMLGEMLDAIGPDEVQLVLPATAGAAVLAESLRCFRPLEPTALSFTKLDEAAGLGDIYLYLRDHNFLNDHSMLHDRVEPTEPSLARRDRALPLSFLSFGQNIAENIEVAGPARLAALA